MGDTGVATRIDFQSSSLTWLGESGESYGRFALESVCLKRDRATGSTTSYGLGAEVLAGNVFGTGNLVLQPPYLFQVVASADMHVFFRTHAAHRPERDSSAMNAGSFREMTLRIERQSAEVLDEFAAIERHFKAHSQLSARIALPAAGEETVHIEFPVKHINIHRTRGLFQIETGPILFPMEFAPGGSASHGVRAFNAAFVHFNRLDEIEVTLKVPTRVGLRSMRFYSETIRLRADVSVLARGR